MINVQYIGLGFGCTYGNTMSEDDYSNGIRKCFGHDEIGGVYLQNLYFTLYNI